MFWRKDGYRKWHLFGSYSRGLARWYRLNFPRSNGEVWGLAKTSGRSNDRVIANSCAILMLTGRLGLGRRIGSGGGNHTVQIIKRGWKYELYEYVGQRG